MNRYFAHILEDLTIDQIVVVGSADLNELSFPESEPLGQEFLNKLYNNNNDLWLETSVDGFFRGRPAIIGGFYIPELDEFGPIPEPEPEPDDLIEELPDA